MRPGGDGGYWQLQALIRIRQQMNRQRLNNTLRVYPEEVLPTCGMEKIERARQQTAAQGVGPTRPKWRLRNFIYLEKCALTANFIIHIFIVPARIVLCWYERAAPKRVARGQGGGGCARALFKARSSRRTGGGACI
jgi:hypothetical protein